MQSQRDRVYDSVTAYDWTAIRSAEAKALLGDLALIAQAVAVRLETRDFEGAREFIRAATLSPIERAFGLTKVLISEKRPLEETWPVLQSTWADVHISESAATRLERVLGHQPTLELFARFADAHPESPQLRHFMIGTWTRYLPFQGEPTSDGWGSSGAYQSAQPAAAETVIRQFLSFERPAQEFNVRVLQRLDMTDLTRPFAQDSDYPKWHETGAAGARVLFVGCRIVELAADGEDLLKPLASLATQLNKNRWGGTSRDLVAVNAAIARARMAATSPILRPVAEELLLTPPIPAHCRFAVALWLDDDTSGIEVRTAGIDLDDALRPFLPVQRAGFIEAFIRRLEAVAPNTPMLAGLLALKAAPYREPSGE